MIIIYTDGSAHPNPGPGGYGVIITENDKIIDVFGKQNNEITSNNREEMKAIIWALENYGKYSPIVYSDSSYAVNTYKKWMFDWERRGWKKSDKKTPENLAIIQNYYKLYMDGWRIDLRKCDGHSGIEGNEMADDLATGKILPTKEL